MRASKTRNGITLRVIAGSSNVIIGIDLQHDKCAGCLGFSIHREDLDPKPGEPKPARWLPNMLRFPSDTSKLAAGADATTETAPLQKFRWGDYTCEPGRHYRYRVVPRYGSAKKLSKIKATDGVSVEVTTESCDVEGDTAVIFNRGAAASRAFNQKFPKIKTEAQLLANDEAKTWLSRGLDVALLEFMKRATNSTFTLHAAIYEFQKDELIQGLVDALQRKAKVGVVVHARQNSPKDKTKLENKKHTPAALKPFVVARSANPQNGIMHNKFVVLLKGKEPVAVWTGSTNWTNGAVYGQLNVGHAINDPVIAAQYEQYYQILTQNLEAADSKHAMESITPVSHLLPPSPGITPIFSPQTEGTMLDLYAGICEGASCLLVCAPFALSPVILKALAGKDTRKTLRFMLLDKEGSLGKGPEVRVLENDPANSIGVAATLSSPLQDMQGKMLEGKEGFRHAGVHIHAKLILANPFGSNPIIVMGSANVSHNSTSVNDSNTLVFRGYTALADIYTTEFMRMFEHYHFRASQTKKLTHKKVKDKALKALTLAEDDSWSTKYYVEGSQEALDRMMFAGTLH